MAHCLPSLRPLSVTFSSILAPGCSFPWVLHFLFLSFSVLNKFFFFFNTLALPHSMWDLSSLTRDGTHTLALEVRSLNHWTTRKVPGLCLLTFCLPLASLPSWVLGPLWLPQLNRSLSHYCRLSSRRSGPVSHHRECLPWLSFPPGWAVDPLSPPPPNEGQREPFPGKGLWRRGSEALNP